MKSVVAAEDIGLPGLLRRFDAFTVVHVDNSILQHESLLSLVYLGFQIIALSAICTQLL